MNRRELLTDIAGTFGAFGAGVALLRLGVGDIVAGVQVQSSVKHRKEQGFASILDVADTSGEVRGTGISFPMPFSNYGPKSITYLIIEQYNITDISITKPTPYGARFTITARDPGEFVCSIVWTAEE